MVMITALSTCPILTPLVALTPTPGVPKVVKVVVAVRVMRTRTLRVRNTLLRVTDQVTDGQSFSRWRKGFWSMGEFESVLSDLQFV